MNRMHMLQIPFEFAGQEQDALSTRCYCMINRSYFDRLWTSRIRSEVGGGSETLRHNFQSLTKVIITS